MNRLIGLVRFLFREFGPLIVFYGVNHFYGIKPAIVASLTVALVEAVTLRIKKRPMSNFFKYSLAMTLVFSAVDLSLETPVLIRYESAIGNILTAVFFGLTLRAGKKPVIQEFAENRRRAAGEPAFDLRPDLMFFFRACTVIWAIYFVSKAGFYVWVANHYSMEEALAMRTVVGNATLYGLMFVNIYFAKPIIRIMAKLRGTSALPEAS